MHTGIRDVATAGSRKRHVGAALALLVGLTAAGCAEEHDVIAPPGSLAFDPEAVASSIFSLRFAGDDETVVQVHTIADAMGLTASSFSRAAEAADPGDGPALSTGRATDVLGRATLPATRAARRPERGERDRLGMLRAFGPRALQEVVASRAAARASGQAVPLFPINFLGKFFVFDASIDAYVELGDGGPSNGVRFELYTVDLASGLPALPLHPIGFVDLLDVSNATSTRLRVRAFDTTGGDAIPIANYLIDGAFATSSAGITVSLLSEGFVHGLEGRFDFSLDELLESDDAAGATIVSSIHRVVSAEGTDVRLEVDGEISNDGAHSDLFFKMDIDGAAGLTLVDLGVVDGLQSGEIQHNGRSEAVVGGTVQQPTFTAVGSREFRLSELAALDEILFGIDDILFFTGEVYAPLADLFGVG